MKVKIRISVPDDVYGIRKVQRETWPKVYPNKKEGITLADIKSKFEDDETPAGKAKLEERKKWYENINRRVWVAESEKRIIGFCTASKGEEHRLQAIYVLPQYQNKKIEKELIEKSLSWMGKEKEILVNVARYNKKAISFYERAGFKKTSKEGLLDEAARLPTGKIIPEIEMAKPQG